MATDYDAPRKTEEEQSEDSLEELKARRHDKNSGKVDEDETEAAESFELPGADLSHEELAVEVKPRQEDEFTCMSCFLVHHRSQLADAKKLMDWLITDEAMAMYNEGYAVLAVPGLAKPVPNIPENLVASFIENDFEWAATNRARILEEWTKRYDSKSEPKS